MIKIIGKCKEDRITKSIFKKNKFGELILNYFKTFNKATVIKTVQYQPKDRHINQCN